MKEDVDTVVDTYQLMKQASAQGVSMPIVALNGFRVDPVEDMDEVYRSMLRGRKVQLRYGVSWTSFKTHWSWLPCDGGDLGSGVGNPTTTNQPQSKWDMVGNDLSCSALDSNMIRSPADSAGHLQNPFQTCRNPLNPLDRPVFGWFRSSLRRDLAKFYPLAGTEQRTQLHATILLPPNTSDMSLDRRDSNGIEVMSHHTNMNFGGFGYEYETRV
ncbi:hypothetical protein SISSUDRAFT_1031756 [Sistotremastrum suecicum HHB10207 ss-3]|uniref:Uncharacterized protein n=1 Tax=Sistotremastrum suecicum HHB10207 ss-3 TaxID=1314776 RepID=A0A166FKF9_9AGAM|nr:hypothetical protein SISSUDRAFT_1031756 [Sistotremastrum suecicum HHB10207 ss-3]